MFQMSRRRVVAALLTYLLTVIAAAAPVPAAAGQVRLAIVVTAELQVPEALVFAGGRLMTRVATNFSAFVIQHGETVLLFDSGLGADVAAQYSADMPLWARPLFRYDDPVRPAAAQLRAAGVAAPKAILLSHAHWDHASALVDFPGAEIWLSPMEYEFVRRPEQAVGGAWPSQVAAKPLGWKPLALAERAHEGFETSLDVFDDGRVVVVGMPGHTPGSIGLFVTTTSGRRYFLVGDAVWSAGALREGRPKFWFASCQVDGDRERTQAMIERIRAVMQRDPSLIVVPAHDGELQNRLGVFPRWLE